ncbi:hypothetical protein GCM10023346_46970 [Arthrobacter gyeryongensis]|uniref:Major facilitator superfamily (MFS) profile domain-containing protein n=1 Tax=Arthrobacter gyeryongensis TaxID=1650592 RepID=A0ABP9SS61_9MICC
MPTPTRPPGKLPLAAMLATVAFGPMLLSSLSATSNMVIGELGISAAQFGLLGTACFAAGAIGNAAFGRFNDKQSDSLLLTLVVGMAAAALALAAVPSGYVLLLVASGLSGLAQSFPNGVTNRILVERVPEDKRISWIGVKQSGPQVSQLVASLAFPTIAAWIGWHGANAVGAVVAGILGILTVRTLAALPLLPKVPTLVDAHHPVPIPAVPVNNTTLIYALSAFGFVNGMGVQATNVYLSLYAVRELNFTLVLGGFAAAAAGAIGVVARVGWGRMMSRGMAAAPLLLLLAAMALSGALAFIMAGSTRSPAFLWLAVALHGASALGVSVVLMAAVVRSVPTSSMGMATGWVSAGQFGGFTIGPLTMGALISSPGGFTLGWSAVAIVYALCVLLALYLVLRRRRKELPGSQQLIAHPEANSTEDVCH